MESKGLETSVFFIRLGHVVTNMGGITVKPEQKPEQPA